MDQTDEITQAQKPKICKLAVASPLVVIFGYSAGGALACGFKHIDILSSLGLFLLIVLPVAGLVLGIIADRRIYKSEGMLKGRVFSISGTGLGLIFILISIIPTTPPSRREMAYRVACGMNLSGLGRAILVYDCDYDRYPTPNIWCDLLVKYADVDEENFVCRGALETGDKGPCHYALNPNCSSNSPNDVVLLFETKGGWNQFGGPELLTAENHGGKGCVILFNDAHVDFIRTERLGELNWGNEPSR